MVDVGTKPVSLRRAVASGLLHLQSNTLAMIDNGSHAKGDVLAVARIAAIMAAKRTADLVPLCHPLALTRVEVELSPLSEQAALRCVVTVETRSQTGVEMEALCAVQVGLLTLYDMCKSVDRGMVIDQVMLVEKSGGQSGDWRREP